MTCVCGVEHRGRVWLAGDSALSWGDRRVCSREPKVRRMGPHVVLGAAGRAADCDVAMGATVPRYDGSDPLAWAREALVPALAEALRAAGIRRASLELLAGIGGVLVAIDGVRSVDAIHTWDDGVGAIGDGGLGALCVLWATTGAPRGRLELALEASARYCSTVAEPWTVVVA